VGFWSLELTGKLPKNGLAAERLLARCLALDIVFDSPQHFEESISIEFESRHVLFDFSSDLINGDKKGQLALA